ncbi:MULTISPECIES: 2-oxoadipate dioxygenase/decarboxylase HglS [Rhizobium/Agrobacterium group]|uniref:2-oxoadipate dioxygenase/decarboxylase n=2 Tax=Rhizobium/Agrobacterium group TaxID=227290 RepID=A0A9X3R0D7_9HYPH|nr:MULTISPECIES: VOC family protein [Rhizobium/Agrobacterium group]MBO9126233.1 VOC family protein [Rhizobium sp. 16-488-2b]MBO9176817.1 VOC family protein [Rhizobium sp. 16-488-2a]MBO9197386.1 VOC family protein [Rhizobium sp. 16-449-1b]MCZ7466753.1 VOC family protein [Rhizobium rhizogenes]MCZ7939217.1 VOC family protein [Agrobacterium salinitolerans]
MTTQFAHPDDIRTRFSKAMSEMYRNEVPQYGTLMELVSDVNDATLANDPALQEAMVRNDELDRLDIERHGAIRLGTAEELFNIRRVFAVMGMYPVGYYDLSVAGIPVHSTAFRPVDDKALSRNPFRVFTSLLRLELIEDEALRAEAAEILGRRQIFTAPALALVEKAEADGGLSDADADDFVREALETFRWHNDATVTLAAYKRLHDAHRLIADVVSFKGPHINHLTPRTLDIDAVQAEMPKRGISPKAVIEGPPRRKCAILLRQTSFKALEEGINFKPSEDQQSSGMHTARFGEIEQRGVALTPKGRKLYDDLLAAVRRDVQVGASGGKSKDYNVQLTETFGEFPDEWADLRKQELAYFRYSTTEKGSRCSPHDRLPTTLDALIDAGFIRFDPIVYEDFLPVSAAGIFQSNLGTDAQQNYSERSNRDAFENGLGSTVQDELALYAEAENRSLDQTYETLGHPELAQRSIA